MSTTLSEMRTGWKIAYGILAVLIAISFIARPGLMVLQLINSLVFSMILILIALGLSLILGLMGVINFAHGALFMCGGYFAFALTVQLGLPFWAVFIAVPLLVGVVGVLMEIVTLRPLYGMDPLYGLLVTFGLTLMFEDAIRFLWGSSPLSYSGAAILHQPVSLGITRVPAISLFTAVVGTVTIIAVYLMIVRTDFGLTIRAGVQDPEMTELTGVNLPRKFTLLFFIGSAIAGLAGVLRGAETGIDPGMAVLFIIIVFVVIVVGGMGSFLGSIVGGLLIGVSMFMIPEMISILTALAGAPNVAPPALERVVPFIVMIVVLLDRPRGLFGEEGFLE